MKYISTRGLKAEKYGADAIIEGLAADGGLYMPKVLPKIDILDIDNLDYKALCVKILEKFFPQFKKSDLEKICQYDKFEIEEIVKVKSFEDKSFLELFHGPTASFKDMALSLLPNLMEYSYRLKNRKQKTLIMTATSGDTGSAALEAFANKKNFKIAVFYPVAGVSEMQKLQMDTVKADNVYVYPIEGNFDDAQNAIKELFLDPEISFLANKNNYRLSSANSINIGRLISQTVYYYYAYLYLMKAKIISDTKKLDISVPTGNFGNILAAIIAKEMGLPIENIICASNANNILTEFIKTRKYDIKREFKRTLSPSMDIIISSNLERFLFLSADYDHNIIKKSYNELKENNSFKWKENLPSYLKAMSVNDDSTIKSIREAFERYNYLIDPHTAVAYEASKLSNNHCLIVSTASPYKFADSILMAIDNENRIENSLESKLKKIEKISASKMPNSIAKMLKVKTPEKEKIEISKIKTEIKKIMEESI
ncbi:MAG: threonine synthase [Tissierellia bacterium]|nr:threonine synthase [Tissierellia bacterium]